MSSQVKFMEKRVGKMPKPMAKVAPFPPPPNSPYYLR
jgi:hypothetical protein